MEKHISYAGAKEKELEKRILQEYAGEEVRKHLEYFTTLIRRAGTDEERQAAAYIADKLADYGLEREIYEFDAFINHPGKAELKILAPLHANLPCLPCIFVAPTPPEGLEGELIFLGKGTARDYEAADVRGKIVLIAPEEMDGQLAAARLGEERGAIAQIHITRGRPRTIAMGQFRQTWGNPTPDTVAKLPRTPAVSLCQEDGQHLTELVGQDRLRVQLQVDSWRGYRKVRLPVGFLPGASEPDKFVLLAGHYCSWFTGATDNAAANALMLEMARIFAKHRKNLARGIRFAWWTGHEQGLYAGSTWYLDNFWDDLRDHAVAYLVMDGLGRAGASGFEGRNTEEARKFQESLITEILGRSDGSKRVPKFGDQSFWGLGLPSLTGRPGFTAAQAAQMGMDPIWYGHSEEDTLDKVDLDLLPLPFKIYMTALLRLCNNPVLPFEFVTLLELFVKVLRDLQDKGGADLDLTSLITQAKILQEKAEALNKNLAKILFKDQEMRTDPGGSGQCREINACFMELSRILLPALASQAGKYGQDPMGAGFTPLPALQTMAQLPRLDRASEAYRALHTSLVRERNRLSDVFRAAQGILDYTLKRL